MGNIEKYQNIIHALLKISSLVVESKDLAFIYKEIHNIIQQILYAKNFAIVRYNENDKAIVFDYFVDEIDAGRMKGQVYPLGRGLSSYVINSRAPTLISGEDILKLQGEGTLNLLGTLPKSWMGAPIQNIDTVYGLIFIQSYTGRHMYTQEDLNILTFVASHLSIVFETKLIIESEKSALKLIHKNYNLINHQKETLESTLKELKEAQSELIEKEKMASLGGLVAGISHEVNTPIGICVTGASHLLSETKLFNEKCEAGTATNEDLNVFLEDIKESSTILLSNSHKAANLVSSFKMVAVDQSSNEVREINLSNYLDEIMVSLRPMLKKMPHEIFIDCDESIRLYTIPGAISQVLTNLITNSIKHGFESKSKGHIYIKVEDKGGVVIDYQDDGIGMKENELSQLFEPFYTTKRASGGSGLGAHLIYNLVTQSLSGKINVSSQVGKGLHFQISIPKLPLKKSL